MNGRIIGYVKIYDETEQGAIQIQFRAPPPPICFCLILQE